MTLPSSSGFTGERASWLSLVPLVVTLVFYRLPPSEPPHLFLLFLPQLTAYSTLVIWFSLNSRGLERLGMVPARLREGVRWGLPTGIVLGLINVSVILVLVPRLGGDILFLRDTPHARMPWWLMVPWIIVAIALFVEVNFRGFLLGRLVALWRSSPYREYDTVGQGLAIVASAIVFAFDPFMVTTFQHLHWIALWDGLVWGWLWVRLHNLAVPIVAHSVEVIILYTVLKLTLPS